MLKAHWVDLYPIFSYFPVAAVEYVEQWRHALVAGLTLGEGSRQNRGEAAADRPAGSRGINPIDADLVPSAFLTVIMWSTNAGEPSFCHVVFDKAMNVAPESSSPCTGTLSSSHTLMVRRKTFAGAICCGAYGSGRGDDGRGPKEYSAEAMSLGGLHNSFLPEIKSL